MSRRHGRLRAIAIVALVFIAFLLISTWIATRAVFFLGTDDEGFVTVYQGVPYEIGVPLYSESFASGLQVSELPPARRPAVTDHKWRSRDDALAELRTIEKENRP